MSAPEPMTGTTSVARGPRWMRVLLVLSLALNLLILGIVGSALWRFRYGGPHTAGPIAMMSGAGNLLGFAQSLPPERRRMIWRETADQRQVLRPLRAEMRQLREAVQAGLLADPFDPQRFADAQAKALEAEVRARGESQKLFLAIARLLTKDERAQFARWQPPADQKRKGGSGWWAGQNSRGAGFRSPPSKDPSEPQPVPTPR